VLVMVVFAGVQVHRAQLVWQDRKVNKAPPAKSAHLASMAIQAGQVQLVPRD